MKCPVCRKEANYESLENSAWYTVEYKMECPYCGSRVIYAYGNTEVFVGNATWGYTNSTSPDILNKIHEEQRAVAEVVRKRMENKEHVV